MSHGPSSTESWQPFLRSLFIALGGIFGVIVLVAVAGFVWEPAAMTATGLAVVAGIALMLTGRIWMVVAPWKDKTLYGVLSLLVPIYAYVYAFTRKGSALRGFVVLVTGIAPLLLSLLLILIYEPMYSSTARRSAQRADRQSRMESIIARSEANVAPDAPIEEATFRLFSLTRAERIKPDGEQAVKDCKHFIHGSIRVDRESRTVSFRHRGGDNLASQYRLMIASASGTNIGGKVNE